MVGGLNEYPRAATLGLRAIDGALLTFPQATVCPEGSSSGPSIERHQGCLGAIAPAAGADNRLGAAGAHNPTAARNRLGAVQSAVCRSPE
jgi:hypothetical protein